MKKIINAPENVVNEMLAGLVAANPDTLDIIPEKRIILRKERKATSTPFPARPSPPMRCWMP